MQPIWMPDSWRAFGSEPCSSTRVSRIRKKDWLPRCCPVGIAANSMSGLFETFDFKLLDDPEFGEDSVREELVVPLLAALGYSASPPYRIIRSKKLEHPFVY